MFLLVKQVNIPNSRRGVPRDVLRVSYDDCLVRCQKRSQLPSTESIEIKYYNVILQNYS